MGFPTTASMTLGAIIFTVTLKACLTVATLIPGMLLGWAFLTPLAQAEGWTVGDIAGEDGGRAWILWPSLAIMMVESMLSLVTMALSTASSQSRSVASKRMQDEQEEEITDAEEGEIIIVDVQRVPRGTGRSEEVPSRNVVAGGIVMSIVSGVLLVGFVFGQEGIKYWATLIALALASLFSILG